jgi:hypothetical protein
MRLVHSISMTLLVSAVATLSACSDDPADPAPASGGSGGAGGSGAGTAGSGAGTAGSGAGTAGSGAGTAGSAGSGANDHPTDSTAAGITAYLDANSFTTTGMGWRPEAIPSNGTSQPHLAVKRYYNETLIASKAAGNTLNAHTVGSMTVKEILEGGAVVGKAAMLRNDTTWVYYCMSTLAERCFAGSMANMMYYGPSANTTGCACHGSGNIVSIADAP